MTIWFTLLGMGLVTFLSRALPFFTLHGELPNWLQRWLACVPPAIFAALIVPPLLLSNQQIVIDERLIAGLVGGLIAWQTRNVPATIVGGMLAYWAIRLWWG